MKSDRISSQFAGASWQANVAPACHKRSAHALRMIELAHTLAAAETSVLKGDDAKAVADLRRLQADTLEMLAQLEQSYAQAV